MKCPNCTDSTLVMTDRQSVEIDYCPTCRGIWLDRGELDKLLDRAAKAAAPSYTTQPASTRGRQPDFDDSGHRHDRIYYPNRKKSWLHEIFD